MLLTATHGTEKDLAFGSINDGVYYCIRFGSKERTEKSCDFLLRLCRSNSPFTCIIVIWDIRVVKESEDIVLLPDNPFCIPVNSLSSVPRGPSSSSSSRFSTLHGLFRPMLFSALLHCVCYEIEHVLGPLVFRLQLCQINEITLEMYEANLVGLDIHAEVSSVPVRYKYCIWESLVKCILYCFVTTFCMCFEKDAVSVCHTHSQCKTPAMSMPVSSAPATGDLPIFDLILS